MIEGKGNKNRDRWLRKPEPRVLSNLQCKLTSRVEEEAYLAVDRSGPTKYSTSIKSLQLGDIDISLGNQEPTLLVDIHLGNVRIQDCEILGKAYNWHRVQYGVCN